MVSKIIYGGFVLIFFFAVFCAAEDEEIPMQWNRVDYLCKKHDPYHYDYYDPYYAPKKDCTLEDLVPCQLRFVNVSLELKHANPWDFPSFIYCDSLKEMLHCLEELSHKCTETKQVTLYEWTDEIQRRIYHMKDNCLCRNSKEHNYQCQDPCSAMPCLNEGVCMTDMKKEEKSDEHHEDYYYDYYHSSKPDAKFTGCNCTAPYTGKFCQESNGTPTCQNALECDCPKGLGGPYCNMACDDIKKNPITLFKACIPVAHDVYFASPYPAACTYNLVFTECVTKTTKICDIKGKEFLKELKMYYSAQQFIRMQVGETCHTHYKVILCDIFGPPPGFG